MNDYSKIIYKVKDYIDTDIDALRFYCDYYKKNNSMSYALPYVEMLADKTKDEDVINDIVEYYSNYYAYCQDKQKVKDTLMKYSKNPKAAFKLGQLYFYGIDCDQDYKEAYKYLEQMYKE
jgi:TPR repeat protein